ncbi:MAG: hypothetical protein ACFUZC_03390 [Chthoniobacteraceae bacterium]
MKNFLIGFLLRWLRGRAAARLNRVLILLVFALLLHIPYLAHLCNLLQLPPEAIAGCLWALVLEALHWLRDNYPQAALYIDPLVQGIEEAGKPLISNEVTRAQPVKPQP